jgi:hypothetical protein
MKGWLRLRRPRHPEFGSVSKSPFNARNVDSKRRFPFILPRAGRFIVGRVSSPAAVTKQTNPQTPEFFLSAPF